MAAINDFNNGDKIRLKHWAYDRYLVIKEIDDKRIILDEFGRITIPNIVDAKSKEWYIYKESE